MYATYRTVQSAMTLTDPQGHSPITSLLKCDFLKVVATAGKIQLTYSAAS